jgi:hypothetical protein
MTVEERNRFADELRALSAPALANKVFELARSREDPGQLDLAWRLLVPKLQTELGDADKAQVYTTIESLLLGAELEHGEKAQLVEMLGRTATPESVRLLIDLAQRNSLPELQPLIHLMIRDTGDFQWEGRFHEELSPILEQAWGPAEAARGLREPLANAIAGVGARSGIELLYREALRGGETVAEFSSQQDNLAWHVMDVFQKIRNPAAVPLLADRLGEQPLDNLALGLSGSALAAMGRPEATSALLRWAEQSQRDVGQLAEPWFSEVRDPDSLALLEKAVAAPARFSEQSNWQALDRALREWHARRDTTTSGD